MRHLLAMAIAAIVLSARSSSAQEFFDPAPAGQRGIAALLERGLSSIEPAIGATALAIRWHGLAELQTRSAAVGLGMRALRLAAGASQTGESDLGWSALALGAGAGGERYGFALRGCVRRRPAIGSGGEEAGGEVGAGAWVAASKAIVVWTSAPQLWTRGDPPPLERWLEIGSRLELDEAQVWLARSATPGATGLRSEHVAGILLPAGPAALWIEARDHPPRGTLGLAVAAGELRVTAAVDGHPVLGETVRIALAFGERPWW